MKDSNRIESNQVLVVGKSKRNRNGEKKGGESSRYFGGLKE